jgi:ABC-type cobalt transport system substrate-binding protein
MHELCIAIIVILLAIAIVLTLDSGKKGNFDGTDQLFCKQIHLMHGGKQQVCQF